ncbi:MAG: hypothetical protein ACRETB_04625 [Steroidobacteraceae bacterium]
MPQQSVAGKGSPISPGAELFSLCQTSAPDGRLSRLELRRLTTWLDRSVECDVPSWRFVRELIAHSVRTGRIAPVDLQALGRVLEPSFPLELRRRPAALRLAGSARMPYPDDSATERTRNEVLASACFMVAGCQGKRRTPVIPRQARAGEPVLLVLERPGQGAASPVEVRTANGRPLGFVPAQRARDFAPLLDRGARYRAHLIAAASGAQAPVLIVQAFVYRGDAALGFPYSSARRVVPRRLSRLSWMLLRASVALAIAAAAAIVLRV